MYLFKIRDRITGLFSTGGVRPRWTKRGKTWTNLGHVKLHLGGGFPTGTYHHAEVVTYRVVEESYESVGVLLTKVQAEQAEKLRKRLVAEQAAKAERARRVAEAEIAELQKLKAKYPNA